MKPFPKLFLRAVAIFVTLCALSATAHAYDTYKVSGTRIFKNNVTSTGWIPRGVNMMNQFDRGTLATNNAGFNVNIVRETVFDFKDVDFGTGTTQEWNGSMNVTLHGLRNLVTDNRANGKVTILCPFSWDGFTPLAGHTPQNETFFNDGSYNNRLYQLALAFKDDTDVWISTWNEPYADEGNTSWYANQLSMIQSIRNAGNNNPIFIDGTMWSNSTARFLDNGQSLLNASPTTPSGSKNIIFDWHAYKYMEWNDNNQAGLETEIQKVKNLGLCLVMGEYGPETSVWDDQYGHHIVHINPVPVQNAVINKKIGGLAWYFKRGGDGNCLVWSDGTPKNDVYSWYDTVKAFLNTMSTVTDPVNSSSPIPGMIQAENYDTGGEGVAYHDVDAPNQGGQYRSDAVDIEACADTNGGYDVGWTNAGEYLKFTSNVATSGTYNVTFRVSSGASGGSLHLEDTNGTNLTGTVSVPGTGGWQTWVNVTKTVSLGAGSHTLKLVIDAGSFNINYLNFVSAAPTNLMTDPGFELNSSVWNYASSSRVNTGARTGTWRGQINGSGGGGCYQFANVQPNSSYTLSAWVKSGAAGQPCYIYGNGTGTEVHSANFSSTTTWTKYTITFTTDASHSTAEVGFWADYGSGATADDFVLTKN